MSHSDREVYLHLVWATKNRQPTLPAHLERAVHRVMYSEVCKVGCRPVAINGTVDHVHLLIQMGPDVTLGQLANRLKGATAHFINENRVIDNDPLFRWQEGYGVYSIGKGQIKTVASYVNHQKERHEAANLWQSLEPTEPALQSQNQSVPQSN